MTTRPARRRLAPLLLLALAVVTTACQHTTPRAHHRLLAGEVELPQRVVVMPPFVDAFELDASNTLVVRQDLARQAERNLREALDALAHAEPGDGGEAAPGLPFELVALPRLRAGEDELVRDHVGLFDVTAQAALEASASKSPAWKHRYHRFEATLGPGLADLGRRADAEVGLFLSGVAAEPTTGREWKQALGGPQFYGNHELRVGLVELATGDLLWLTKSRFVEDLLEAESAEEAREERGELGGIFADFPELDDARARARGSADPPGAETLAMRAYLVDVPAGWVHKHRRLSEEPLELTRDGWLLHWVRFDAFTETGALPRTGRRVTESLSRRELVDRIVAEYRANLLNGEVELVSSGRELLAGREGFRVHLRAVDYRGLSTDQVILGFFDGGRLYALRYEAPTLSAFERDLELVEEMARSIRRES